MSRLRVLTLGTFDCFHRGHLRLLERASQFGELIVGVNSDIFVKAYKGRPPERSEGHRMDDVHSCECVSETWLNDGPGHRLIKRIVPNLIVVGSDWHENDYCEQINMPQRELDRLSIGIVYLPRTPNVSTRQLRDLPPPTSERIGIKK